MTYVLEMSTDEDIIHTEVSSEFGDVVRYGWYQVKKGGLDIPAGSTIIVIAHGNNEEIGNKGPDISINPAYFVELIVQNMKNNGVPADVYISTCGYEVAAYTAKVVFVLQYNRMWYGNWFYGHNEEVAGKVPPPWPDDAWSPVQVKYK